MCFASNTHIHLSFRIGGESLAVAQNTYAVSWFKGKELNLVFGLQLSMARIVSLNTQFCFFYYNNCYTCMAILSVSMSVHEVNRSINDSGIFLKRRHLIS